MGDDIMGLLEDLIRLHKEKYGKLDVEVYNEIRTELEELRQKYEDIGI